MPGFSSQLFSRDTKNPLKIILQATTIIFALLFSAFSHALADHDTVSGLITEPGEQHSYFFTANVDDTFIINATSGAVISVYNPDGTPNSSSIPLRNGRRATQSGTYTVLVTGFNNYTGSYQLHFAKVPGANEHGSLGNQATRSGNLTESDIDTYTFYANTGDSYVLSASTGTSVAVYYPDGSRDSSSTPLSNSHLATQTGTYTVVVASNWEIDYDLHFARVPSANEHGSLIDQSIRVGELTDGDLDSYTFDAEAGDIYRITYSSGAGMLVFLPSGRIHNTAIPVSSGRSAPQTGTYTVIVRNRNYTGAYQIGFYLTGNGAQEPDGPESSIPSKEACNPPVICSSEMFVGNPINFSQGFKAQAETDYTSGMMAFSRIYRSDSSWTSNSLGERWRHNYSRSLNFFLIGSTNTVDVVDGRGATIRFQKSGSTWLASDADYQATFEEILDANSFVGYKLTTPDDTEEIFNGSGQLTRIIYRADEAIDFTYDASGRLLTLSNEKGHTLTVGYDGANRINSLTTPDGTLTYSYDSNNNLATVTNSDTTTRTYHYEDGDHVHALTGISNENGVRLSTYAYDSQGRAISSEQANGTNQFSIDYNADDSVTVTNPLGKQITYDFQTILGVRKITSVNELASASSPAKTKSYTYTTEGWLESITDKGGNTTRYTYDSAGLQISRVEADGTTEERTITTSWETNFRLPDLITEPGRTTDYDYDAFGRLTSITLTDTLSNETRTTSYTYHPNSTNGNGETVLGRLATENGPRTDVSDITQYEYDANFNLTKITNALGHEIHYSNFDGSGRPQSITDSNGVITTLSYDLLGRLLSQTTANRTTNFVYYNNGTLQEASYADGRQFTFTYDDAERLTAIESITGERTEYVLDNAGNRLETILRSTNGSIARHQRLEFDDLSRLAATIDRINNQDARTEYGYDGNNNLTSVTDPYNVTSSYQYDALQRLTQYTDAELGDTFSGYNTLNQQTSVTAPNNSLTSYSRNAFGDVTQETSPDRGTTSYLYDSAGNLVSRTDARNITATYTYDALNRISSISYPDSSENVTYTYDNNPGGAIVCTNGIGRLCRVSDESGITDFAYDQYGNITERIHTELGINYSHSFAYDNANQISQITTTSGRIIAYIRNLESRISEVLATLEGQLKTLVDRISYDPDGMENSADINNGLTQLQTYDENGLYVSSSIETTPLYGDVGPVSGPDGQLNAADWLVMMRIVIGNLKPSPGQLENGDMYPEGAPDGVIGIQDLLMLQQELIQ